MRSGSHDFELCGLVQPQVDETVREAPDWFWVPFLGDVAHDLEMVRLVQKIGKQP
jgi:hypothetical protein